MNNPIQRYEVNPLKVEPDNSGNVVLWADHLAALEAERKLADRLKTALVDVLHGEKCTAFRADCSTCRANAALEAYYEAARK